jgi:hypothetical protein
MSIQLSGNGGVVAEVETASRAQRVIVRPLDVATGGGGSYAMALTTGTMAAGISADSEILQFRWTSTTYAALIRRVQIEAIALGTAFTAGQCIFSAFAARSFTAAGTGGGAATITTNNAKLNTDFATTQVAEIRVATTAALTAGTKTLDAQPLARHNQGVANTAWLPITPNRPLLDISAERYPLRLEAQSAGGGEGLIITTTVPATGTWSATINIEWDEIAVASY